MKLENLKNLKIGNIVKITGVNFKYDAHSCVIGHFYKIVNIELEKNPNLETYQPVKVNDTFAPWLHYLDFELFQGNLFNI